MVACGRESTLSICQYIDSIATVSDKVGGSDKIDFFDF